ncbi:MAG TPA: sensor histidine kinase [Thermoanaerobaculia bacterium]|nr:sensor histidine kinase [Thermoanaerobaculia bacterium]HUM30700.1 sensor histidine kinase [Thermoanaerobaculia bacterium]HXK68892.1 sensor histidine kinase [Thermoanaerobaculia bacterium]
MPTPDSSVHGSGSFHQAEKDLLLWALTERVKELTALHAVARLLHNHDRKPAELLQEIVMQIPPAWQYPEITAAHISVGEVEVFTPSFKKTPWMQTETFRTRNGRSGRIEVAYLEEKPPASDGSFLDEESALIQSLAQMLQSYFERYEAEEDLRHSNAQLEHKIRERTTELSQTNAALLEEIAERQRVEENNRRLASQLALAEEREKRAIASNLHDHIGQALAILKGRLTRLQSNAMFTGMEADLEESRSLLDKIIQATRTLTFEISPPVLYDLGLEAALEWLSKQFRQKHGLIIKITSAGFSQPLQDDLKITLFRSVQELLINVSKHAQASLVKIQLQWDKDLLRMTVTDDGVGIEPQQIAANRFRDSGFGLFSIRERMVALGGNLDILRGEKNGSIFILSIPLSPVTREEEFK